MSSQTRLQDIEYPESDGRPMGESDLHRDWMIRIIELLKRRYRGQRVYVSGDLLVYYEEGNPKKFIVPDALVVKDSDPGRRRIYKLWEEGKPPDAVFETTSRSTKKNDQVIKPQLYRQMGVREYFLFDPTSDYLKPALQGYRLEAEGYTQLEPDSSGALESRELGLLLRLERGDLAMYDAQTGARLETGAERAEAAEAEAKAANKRVEAAKIKAEAAETKAEAAETKAKAAETKAETTEAELGAARTKAEAALAEAKAAEARAEAAEAKADAAEAKADAAETRAGAAEAKAEALKAKADAAEARAEAAEAALLAERHAHLAFQEKIKRRGRQSSAGDDATANGA
jgi:Uma2 family endonuclease